jgi:AraC-like DNA-binding protein
MFDAVSTLFLLAAIQGILLSAVLFTRKRNHVGNILLACATLALSVELIFALYYSKGWYREFPHLMGISYPFPFLYGPIFYLYARLVSKQADRLRPIDLLHLAPLVIAYLVSAPYYGMSGPEKIRFVESILHQSPPQIISIIGSFVPIQGIIYTVLVIRVVAQYDRRIKDSFSNVDRINLHWLKYLSVGLIVIWSFVGLQFFIRFFTPVTVKYNFILYVLTSAFIYLIGYTALKQPEIFAGHFIGPGEGDDPEKYQKSGLNEEGAEALKQSLLEYMRADKPYLNDELTLQKLAAHLSCSQHHLSEVINSRLKQSYYDFVNGYRVEEFKSRVADPANDRFNLLTVAFDSGFKSKGTFNAIFKKSTGMTPSEYKSKLGTAGHANDA